MYEKEKDYRLDEELGKLEKKHEPYTKEKQLSNNRIKPKAKSTFGKKQTQWGQKRATRTKNKKNDVVDDDYTKWLCGQACIVTGRKAKRGIGVDNMHGHHIDGRNGGRNDYRQVPLIGFVHSWGGQAYHNNTKDDFIKKNNLHCEDVKEYFNKCADDFIEKYIAQGGIIKTKTI